MDIFNALMAGFATAITPANLLWCLVGCALGTAVGVLPGIGPAVAVAMLLPITAKVEVTASMIFFAGIYYGAMYGGSTTSILLNTPGETASMVTAMEGNKMAKSGRAGAALATAGPMPGSTPTAVPSAQPTSAHTRLPGDSAVANPCSSALRMSMLSFQGNS